MNKYTARALINQAVLRCHAGADYMFEGLLVTFWPFDNVEQKTTLLIEDAALLLKDCHTKGDFWQRILHAGDNPNEKIFERRYEVQENHDIFI